LALISGQVPNGHDSDRQGSSTGVHAASSTGTAKYPTLTSSDETGFRGANARAAGPDKGSWDFAEAVVAQERQDPRGRRLAARSEGHVGANDASGEQTITDGPFVRIKGDDADAPQPGFVPRVASNHRCGKFSAPQIRVSDRA